MTAGGATPGIVVSSIVDSEFEIGSLPVLRSQKRAANTSTIELRQQR